MKSIHIIDDKDLKACADKAPKHRNFNLSYSATAKITCESCKSYFGKPYFPNS